jgi:hypothetical protein
MGRRLHFPNHELALAVEHSEPPRIGRVPAANEVRSVWRRRGS